MSKSYKLDTPTHLEGYLADAVHPLLGMCDVQLFPEKSHRRRSPQPIASYGIILFTMVPSPSGSQPSFLIYQRRDNYEYIDILRGVWNTEERLCELIDAISDEERERLTKYSFRELWDDLWVVHGSDIHVNGFEKAHRKFSRQRSLVIQRCLEPPRRPDPRSRLPPWGFPKGKKNEGRGGRESDRVCALREFAEETRLPIGTIKMWDIGPISEHYRGNNNKPYCTHYFLAEVPTALSIKRIKTPGCIRTDAISEEAGDLKWVSFAEAAQYLVPRRLELLRKTVRLLELRYHEMSPFA